MTTRTTRLQEALALRSLRARLLVGLVTLSALCLVLISGLLYAQQRRFAYDRLDDQARSAVLAVNRALNQKGVTGGNGVRPRRERRVPPASPDQDQNFGEGGPPREAALPPEIFGQRRAPDGSVLGSVLVGLSDEAPSPPKLPANLEPGRFITVPAVSGGAHYRVYATNGPDQYSTVTAVPVAGVRSQLARLLATEGLLLAAGLLLMAAAGWWVITYALRPLDAMGETAGAIAAGDLTRRVTPEDDRTEVGRLGLALNAMLRQIERSFTRQQRSEEQLRRFLSDVSHELRTPLAAIRGYAELHRIGATTDAAEVDHSMERIEAESARMGVLVEDLLKLARLDEHREPTRRHVSLSKLAADAVADARASDDSGREIRLECTSDVVVVGDPDGLRQVLGNLLRNALVHTPAGTPIEASVTGDREQARVTVRDHGPGLPAGDPGQLFERFWRSAGGRERGPAGSGLGLAIVAAVMDAHQGTAVAANADGGGAEFTIAMPVKVQTKS